MDHHTTLAEKILSAPPVAIAAGVTFFGLQLSDIAALLTIVWTLMLIYFRLRKEYAKWKAKRTPGLIELPIRQYEGDDE